jgi:hypothetical protein
MAECIAGLVNAAPMLAEEGKIRPMAPDGLNEPAVSFDLTFGARYQTIDFDTAAYGAYFRGHGMPEEQIATRALTFRTGIPTFHLHRAAKRESVVTMAPWTSAKNATASSYHEGYHAVVHQNDEADPAQVVNFEHVHDANVWLRPFELYKAVYKFGRSAMVEGDPLTRRNARIIFPLVLSLPIGAVGVALSSAMAHDSAPEITGRVLSSIATVLMLAGASLYLFDPEERAARREERNNTTPLITFTRKTAKAS